MIHKIILVIVIIIGIYSAFIIISDVNTIYDQLLNFKIEFLPIILSLIVIGWFILFVRWNLLLKNSGITIPIKNNFLIFLSANTFSFIPGEAGGFVKSQILKNKFNIPRAKTSPIVISEMIYTGIGLVSLSLFFGGLFFVSSMYVGSIFACVLIIMFFLINSKRTFTKFMKIISKIKFISNFTKPIEDSFNNLKKSTSGKTAIYSSLLSMLHLVTESTAVFLILYAYGINTIQIIDIIPMYSTSLLLGFVSFLPSGIGVIEGAFSAFLNLRGIELSVALPAVIIVRLMTNWFGVLIGAIALKKNGGLTSIK